MSADPEFILTADGEGRSLLYSCRHSLARFLVSHVGPPQMDVQPVTGGTELSRPRLRGIVGMGLFGTVLIAVGASLPGSPFAFKVPGAWFFGVPSPTSLGVATSSGGMLLAALACGFAGIVVLCRSWLALTRSAMRHAPAAPGRLGGVLTLWSIPLLIAPPLFSNDIYSYAAQGEMVSRHISPYLYGPGVLGASPFSSLAQGVWINTPSPYGPLFTGVTGRLVTLSGHRALVTLVLLRLLALAGVALMAVFVPRLARSYGKDPGTAFCLGVLNPLVLLYLVGSGHNDALMIGLLVAGLTIARRGHAGWGMALCALAAAVKLPGLAGVVAIAWTSGGGGWSRRRALLLTQGAVISAATFELLSAVFGLGWGWVHTIGASDTVQNWITPVDLVAKVVPPLTRLVHLEVASSTFLSVAHILGPLVALAICARAIRRLPVAGLPRTMGVCLLALVLLGPIVQPWYLLWGLVVLATTAGLRTARAIESLSIAISVLGVVGLGQLVGEWSSLTPLFEILLALLVAAAVVVPIPSGLRGEPRDLRGAGMLDPRPSRPELQLHHA